MDINIVEIKGNKEMTFLGYFRIKELSNDKKHLPRYQQIVDEVAKVYLRKDIDSLILEVKGHKNDKSSFGLFYLSDGAILQDITKEEYKFHIPSLEEIYLILGYHPSDKTKKSYYFKSTQIIKENTNVYVDTVLGKSLLLVTDCKKILKDQEQEWLEYLNLKEFKKVLSIIEEVEIVKKETKEKPIEWK